MGGCTAWRRLWGLARFYFYGTMFKKSNWFTLVPLPPTPCVPEHSIESVILRLDCALPSPSVPPFPSPDTHMTDDDDGGFLPLEIHRMLLHFERGPLYLILSLYNPALSGTVLQYSTSVVNCDPRSSGPFAFSSCFFFFLLPYASAQRIRHVRRHISLASSSASSASRMLLSSYQD